MSTRVWALAAAGLLLGMLAVSAAEPPAAFDEVLSLLATRRHGHATFTEVHEMAMLKAPLTSSGELFYDAPDHLEKRTLAPRSETLVLEHGVLTAQRGTRRHVLELSAYPQLVPFVESIRATLAGDRAALEHHFTIEFSGDATHWGLTLTPRDPEVARSVREIRMAGETDDIRTVEIRQVDGDRSVMTITPATTP